MDFRTIEEERLLVYHSVAELQEDLILVFGNCINYNEQNSPLAVTARYVNAWTTKCNSGFDSITNVHSNIVCLLPSCRFQHAFEWS